MNRLHLLRAIQFLVMMVGALLLVMADALPEIGVEPPPDPEWRTLRVVAPDEVPVGESFTVEVQGAIDGEVVVRVDGGAGPQRLVGTSRDGVAAVTVPPVPHPRSGELVVTASADNGVGHTTVTALPGAPGSAVTVFVGPRTVVADGVEWSMIVAVPTDSFGNPVATGTDVDLDAERPGGSVERITVETENLLAFSRIVGGTRAGTVDLVARAGDEVGPRRSFLAVADDPVEIVLELLDDDLVADGVTLSELRTEELFDRYGNQVADGTLAHLLTEGPQGRGRQTTQVIDGRAVFQVAAPTIPGVREHRVLVGSTEGEILTLEYTTAVDELPVAPSTDGRVLVIGPVLSPTGLPVPDGAPVEVFLGDELLATDFLLDGVVQLEVDDLPDGGPHRVEVVVLGVSRAVELGR